MRNVKIPMSYHEWEKVGLPIEGKSLMSSLSLVEAELLEMIEDGKVNYLGDALDRTDWPDPLVLMAVGGLVREGLVTAERRGERIALHPVKPKS